MHSHPTRRRWREGQRRNPPPPIFTACGVDSARNVDCIGRVFEDGGHGVVVSGPTASAAAGAGPIIAAARTGRQRRDRETAHPHTIIITPTHHQPPYNPTRITQDRQTDKSPTPPKKNARLRPRHPPRRRGAGRQRPRVHARLPPYARRAQDVSPWVWLVDGVCQTGVWLGWVGRLFDGLPACMHACMHACLPRT